MGSRTPGIGGQRRAPETRANPDVDPRVIPQHKDDRPETGMPHADRQECERPTLDPARQGSRLTHPGRRPLAGQAGMTSSFFLNAHAALRAVLELLEPLLQGPVIVFVVVTLIQLPASPIDPV